VIVVNECSGAGVDQLNALTEERTSMKKNFLDTYNEEVYKLHLVC